MTHESEPKIEFSGRDKRGRLVRYPMTADAAERYLIHREGLPDPENVLDDDDDQDGQTNA